MSLLDSILGQVSESTTVQNVAAKVGLTPEQVELVGDFLRLIRECACISEFDDESIGRSLELVWER